MRTHGHRAARIDPLDLIQREEVAALSPARYGLVDEEKKYDVNGILWRRVGELGEEEDWLSLRDITEHLRRVYVGNIAYEVRFRPFFFFLSVHLL
jgi:probable 2-oxoglutarate dehydrogenase E1 component DHKTD1